MNHLNKHKALINFIRPKKDLTKKCEPVIIIHGGTSLSDQRKEVELQGVRAAAIAGYAILKAGYSVIDAVMMAVMNMEDNPTFNAGIKKKFIIFWNFY